MPPPTSLEMLVMLYTFDSLGVLTKNSDLSALLLLYLRRPLCFPNASLRPLCFTSVGRAYEQLRPLHAYVYLRALSRLA